MNSLNLEKIFTREAGTKELLFPVPLHMLLDKELINIEDYEQAYHSRLKDLIRLNTIEDPRKVFSMHLGGVIIECLLKKLIVQKHNITKVRSCKKTQWFTQQVYENFRSQGDIDKKEF